MNTRKVSAALVLAAGAGVFARSPVRVTPILLPPQDVPGRPGSQYLDAFQSQLSQSGEAGFVGSVNGHWGLGGAPSINLWRAGAVLPVALVNDPAPGTGASVLFTLNPMEYGFAAGGRVAIFSSLGGSGVQSNSNRGIWYRDDSQLVPVVRTGFQAAGFPAGAIYTQVQLWRISDSGRVVFSGTVDGAGFSQVISMWAWDTSTGGSLIARIGQQAPDTSANFTGFSFPLEVSSRGAVAFCAGLSDGTGGLWIGQPGSLRLALLSGTPAPGFPAGSTISGHLYENKISPVDHVALRAWVDTPGGIKWAIYRLDGQSVVPVVTTGTPVDGFPGVEVAVAVPHVCNMSDTTVFSCSLSNPGIGPTEGIFIRDSLGIVPIALNHSAPPPGAPAGLQYGPLNSVSQVGPVVALNSNDEIVFGCNLYNGTSYGAVYGWTRGTGLFPIAVPGTQLEVPEGVIRTVANAEIGYVRTSTTLDSNNLNDDGSVVLSVEFTDGTNGVFGGSLVSFASAYLSCPAFLIQPRGRSVRQGGSATLTVSVAEAGQLSYQWRRDGVPVVDGAGVSGSTTPTLSIASVEWENVGSYDVTVTSACGTITSQAAVLSLECYANCDSSTIPPVLNINDFQCFLNSFAAQDAWANCDGSSVPPVLNINDFQCFVNAFAAGCS
jgi:hypothetical protein